MLEIKTRVCAIFSHFFKDISYSDCNFSYLSFFRFFFILSLFLLNASSHVVLLRPQMLHHGFNCASFSSDAQLSRERVIQTVDSAVQGGEGRHFTPGLHQLPVRPVTQNGKHTMAAVSMATSLANASGKICVVVFLFSTLFKKPIC